MTKDKDNPDGYIGTSAYIVAELAPAHTEHLNQHGRSDVFPFAGCTMAPCVHYPETVRRNYLDAATDQPPTPVDDTPTSPEAMAERRHDAIVKYVDKLSRELTEALGRLNTTDRHQSEHCRAIGRLLDDVKRIHSLFTRFGTNTVGASKALQADIELVHTELHNLAGRYNRQQALTTEGLDLLGTRMARLEMLADVAGSERAGLALPDEALRTVFDGPEQMAESVFARLRVADAFMAAADPDELDASDYAHHHMQAAAVLAKMYATAREWTPTETEIEQHGVNPYSLSDHQGIKVAHSQHPGHPGGYRFEDCPSQPCVMWTAKARYEAGERFEAEHDIVSTADRTSTADRLVDPSTTSDFASVRKALRAHNTGAGWHGSQPFDMCLVMPCASWTIRGRRITMHTDTSVYQAPTPAGDIVSTGDHLDPADGQTWKPTGDPANDIEAAWKIHGGWDQATTGHMAHDLAFEVCQLGPCVKFTVADRETFAQSRDSQTDRQQVALDPFGPKFARLRANAIRHHNDQAGKPGSEHGGEFDECTHIICRRYRFRPISAPKSEVAGDE